MPDIRDFTVTEFTSTAATWTPDEMPTHVSGDLLIAILAKDSTTGFSTSSGWSSKIAQDLSGGHMAVQAKRAASASETFSVTLTTETGVLLILAIKDCNGSTEADAWDLAPVITGADDTTNPYAGVSGQSTSYANSLIIRATGGGNGNSPTAYPPNVNLYCGDAAQGELGVAYTFQVSSGSIAQANWYGRLNAQALREVLMAVRASGTVTKPPYSDPAVSSATFIRALGWATTNPPFTDSWPASVTQLVIGTKASQVWVYTGSYTDETTDFADPGTADVPVGLASGNILYIGSDSTFSRVSMVLSTVGVIGTGSAVWEYWNGGSWSSTGMPTNNLTASPVTVSFTPPGDWASTSVNGVSKYYIRWRITGAYTTGPTISQGCVNGWPTVYDLGAASADNGTNPYADGMTFTPASARTSIGATEMTFASAQDMDTGIILGCYRYSLHRDGVVDPGRLSTLGGGLNLTFSDSSGNLLSYIISGRDAIDVDKAGWNTYAIDWNGSATAWATMGSISKSAVTYITFGGLGWYGAISAVFSMLCLVTKICIAGGSSGDLLGFSDMDRVFNNSVGILPTFRVVGSQASIYAPIQVGGGDPVHLSCDINTFVFPKRYNIDDKYCLWNAADNVAGINLYPKTGDTIKFTNCVFTSLSPYRWEFDASAATSGWTGDFSGTTIIGATVTMRAVMTFSGMKFINCPSFTLNAAVMQSCAFQGTTVTGGSPGDADNISSSSFTSAGTGHAIVVTGTAATMTLSGLTFTGYAASDGSTGNEAIYINIATGSMTINITNGGSMPSVRTAGCVITKVNARTVRVTAKDANTGSVIQSARVGLWATTGTTVTITRVSSTAYVSHTSHGYQTGQKVAIFGADQGEYNGIKTITYSNANEYTFTVSGTPTTPATGTITSHKVILDGDTNASGIVEDTAYNYVSDLNVEGRVRKGSAATYYKTAPLSGTITSAAGFDTVAFLVPD